MEEYLKENAEIFHEKNTNSKVIIGEIISNTVWIDKLLEEIITKYFVKKEKQEIFSYNIISLEGFTSNMKIEIIRKARLFHGTEIIGSIKQLFENRNIVAHCFRPGHPETIEHPKKGYLDLLKIEKDFNNKFDKVSDGLLTILKNID